MLALIHIIWRVALRPWKYKVISIPVSDDQIALFCGTRKQIETFEKIIQQRLSQQIENDIREYNKHRSL